MKKEITEYEGAEDTTTKIKCGSCEQTWDNRGIRGKQGVNTVILDAVIEKKRHHGWREENSRVWDGTSIVGDRRVRITGEEVEDYCNDCWDAMFSTGPAVEVEEPEYYVEEQTREEYYCDFCDDCMGEESDHKVTLNPRITIERHDRNTLSLSRRRRNTATRQIDESVRCSSRDRCYGERDDVFDCCSSCANEIFNRDSFRDPTQVRQGFVDATVSLTFDVCVQIKDILLLRGV